MMPAMDVNGTRLEVSDRGEGAPLLLVHGTGGHAAIWGEAPERLSHENRVILYDRRGFGASAGPAAERFGVHADDAAALLRSLDAAPATVLGWSGGGVVALDLAVRHPEVVNGLVLAEAPLNLSTHPTASALRMTLALQARRLRGDREGAAEVMYRWSAGYSSGGNGYDRYPEAWRAQMRAHAPSTLHELDQLTRFHLSKRALAGIRCPVTCLLGELSEPAFHSATRLAEKRIAGTRVVDVPRAAHLMPTDNVEAFVGAVEAAAV